MPKATRLIVSRLTAAALQQNTNGIATVNWSNVAGLIQDDGTNRTFIPNRIGSVFFRLYQP